MHKDNFYLWLVGLLPRNIVYWAAIRLAAHATTGQFGNEGPDDVSVIEALRRWEKQ